MAYRMQVEDSLRVTQEALVIVDGSWMNIHDDYCLIVQQSVAQIDLIQFKSPVIFSSVHRTAGQK